MILSRYYNWFLDRYDTKIGYAATMIGAYVVTSIVMALAGAARSDGVKIVDPAEPWLPAISLMFLSSIFVPMLVIAADYILTAAARFVTDNDYSDFYPLGRCLFGEDYATGRTKEAYNMHCSQSFWTRYLAMMLLIAPTMLVVQLLTINPILAPYALIIGMVVGSVVGGLFLARKVYRLSKSLKNHVNDPNAHSTKE